MRTKKWRDLFAALLTCSSSVMREAEMLVASLVIGAGGVPEQGLWGGGGSLPQGARLSAARSTAGPVPSHRSLGPVVLPYLAGPTPISGQVSTHLQT